MAWGTRLLCALSISGSLVSAQSLQHADLQKQMEDATRGFDGRIGVCVQDSSRFSCVNGDERFPLQSVMKLLVAIAVMDAVDRDEWRLTDPVVVRKHDLSLAVQPLAKLVTENGFNTTIDDLVRRAVVDSDSAATDFLVARLGGPRAVQLVLERHHVTDVRFDRDERHLQTEIAGLEWRPQFVDAEVLDRAYAAVPEEKRDAAFRAYQKDPRDTATPRGMTRLLQSRAENRLLSVSSTKRLVEIMTQTATFPDRLKAGVSPGWILAHKTGTSGTWRGVTAVTNDVGILMAPDQKTISLAVFIADSRADHTDRAALMASIARMTIKNYGASAQAVAQNKDLAPLSIARQGYLFAGGKYSTVNGRRVMSGHLYAEFQIPSRQTHPWPMVMIHGGSQSGTNFTGTPDGREGWAQFFLRQGYAVYVVDQPGRGRAAYEADVYGRASQLDPDSTQKRFVAPERYNLWPQAHLHTQWPGPGTIGDPVFDQFFASQLPSIQDFALQQQLNRDAILALLDKIGPAILLTHSQSGAFGWPVADARPDLVKAIVAVEPNGPPFFAVENIPQPEWFRDAASPTNTWGISAVPLAYLPSATKATDLSIVRQDKPDAPDLVKCWMQAAPARLLPNLAKLPILILTAEASYHAPYDHCTVKYLQQAGVRSTWIKLGDVGIHGNGHMMMLENNSHEIGAVISGWLTEKLAAPAK